MFSAVRRTALGRLAHPDGELVLTRAAHAKNIIQMCPTLASATLEEMTQEAKPNQTQFYQLWVTLEAVVPCGLPPPG